MPTLPLPMAGRRISGTSSQTIMRPPWPWQLRRLGEPPEDWAGDGYTQYYGLEFPTEIHVPCDQVCDFLVGATWSLEGGFSGNVDLDAGGPLLPYTLSSSVTGADAELGENAFHDFDTDGTTILFSSLAGVSWQDLDSYFEVLPFSLTDGGGAGLTYPDGIVRIRATQLMDGTSANPAPYDIYPFLVDYSAVVHLPELCKNDTGDLVWRIKMVGRVEVWDPVLGISPLLVDQGLEFVDNDIPANSSVLEPPSTGSSLKLSITRA